MKIDWQYDSYFGDYIADYLSYTTVVTIPFYTNMNYTKKYIKERFSSHEYVKEKFNLHEYIKEKFKVEG